ncbi:MAG: M20 family metallopeptidase [Actinomycetes bacterium]
MVRRVSEASDDLVALSHRIHAHPETAWQEHRAAAWVGEVLAGAGFEVHGRYLGLDTALRARAGTGPLTVVVCAEYDALPGLGHACGHNIIAASSVGTALALADVADELGITVVLLGTPAEEGGGGKIELLERGGFDDADLAVMAHPGPVDVARAAPFAVSHLDVRYHGHAAHAAAYPEDGVNASDAFTVAQVAIGLLRQQLAADTRVHGLVTRAGEAPNAIPELSEGRWYVRASSTERMLATRERVLRCFEAGAVATGCTVEVSDSSRPYTEFRTDPDLVDAYIRNAETLGRSFSDGSTGLGRMSRASTDMGNVSQVVPAIHPYVGIDSAPAVNHQLEFASACISSAADAAVLDAALGLAWTVADVAADDDARARVVSRRELP